MRRDAARMLVSHGADTSGREWVVAGGAVEWHIALDPPQRNRSAFTLLLGAALTDDPGLSSLDQNGCPMHFDYRRIYNFVAKTYDSMPQDVLDLSRDIGDDRRSSELDRLTKDVVEFCRSHSDVGSLMPLIDGSIVRRDLRQRLDPSWSPSV